MIVRLMLLVGYGFLLQVVPSNGKSSVDGADTERRSGEQILASEADVQEQSQIHQEFSEDTRSQSSEPTYRIALDEDVPAMRPLWDRQYDFSPEGDRIVYQTREGLFVSDITGTVRRQLVKQSDDPKDWYVIFFRVGQPRWSPDGRLIAYFAGKRRPPGNDPEDHIWTIFIIDPEGGTPRKLVEYLNPEPFGGLCWTPDGAGLTYLSREGVQVLDLEGETSSRIEVEGKPWATQLTGYSPDGRWLTLQLKADLESGNNWDTDLYIVPSAGGQPVQLTFVPGFDGNPAWSSDGKALYFISARGAERGSSNIWKRYVDPQTGRPLGEPVQVTFFRDATTAHPQVVGDGSRIAFFLERKRHSIQVAPEGELEQARTIARGISPMLSPDGKTVLYVGEGPDHQGIFSVASDGGTPQRVGEFVPSVDNVDLSPDGKSLAYFAGQGDERGLYTHPVFEGEPTLRARTGGKECCTSPRWSPDGTSIGYTYGDGLFVVALSGGQPRKLATLRGWEAWTLRWSPDGEYLAALGYQESEENNAVVVVPAQGGDLRWLSGFEDYKEGLEWHPNGQSLTYHLSKHKSQTNRTYLDGRPPELFLDKDDIWDYVGRWAPDGERYFLSGFKRDKGECVYVYSVRNDEYSLFADGAASLPSWSGDQKTVVWTIEQKVSQLWLMEDFE